MNAVVITVSDKGAAGQRVDASGPAVAELLQTHGITVRACEIVPDEPAQLEALLVRWTDDPDCDLVVTTGGTGVSPRDITPDVTSRVIEREVPGMAEAMRMVSFQKTPHALISRAIVGIRQASLIINVPGSPRGAVENLAVVMPAISHALAKLQGDAADCAT